MPDRQGDDLRNFPQNAGEDPLSAAHEFGHNFGEGDPGGKYYSPGGAMDYNGPFPVTNNDVVNIVKAGLDAWSGNQIVPGTNVKALVNVQGASLKASKEEQETAEKRVSNLKSSNVTAEKK